MTSYPTISPTQIPADNNHSHEIINLLHALAFLLLVYKYAEFLNSVSQSNPNTQDAAEYPPRGRELLWRQTLTRYTRNDTRADAIDAVADPELGAPLNPPPLVNPPPPPLI